MILYRYADLNYVDAYFATKKDAMASARQMARDLEKWDNITVEKILMPTTKREMVKFLNGGEVVLDAIEIKGKR